MLDHSLYSVLFCYTHGTCMMVYVKMNIIQQTQGPTNQLENNSQLAATWAKYRPETPNEGLCQKN